MSDLKFKQTGLRVLDSREGDLLIADPRLNLQLMLTSEFLAVANEDEQKLQWLGRKFLDFMAKHTEARWKMAIKEIREIEAEDPQFVQHLLARVRSDKGTIEDLRKIEKDIFFWKIENGKIPKSKFKPYAKNI